MNDEVFPKSGRIVTAEFRTKEMDDYVCEQCGGLCCGSRQDGLYLTIKIDDEYPASIGDRVVVYLESELPMPNTLGMVGERFKDLYDRLNIDRL